MSEKCNKMRYACNKEKYKVEKEKQRRKKKSENKEEKLGEADGEEKDERQGGTPLGGPVVKTALPMQSRQV